VKRVLTLGLVATAQLHAAEVVQLPLPAEPRPCSPITQLFDDIAAVEQGIIAQLEHETFQGEAMANQRVQLRSVLASSMCVHLRGQWARYKLGQGEQGLREWGESSDIQVVPDSGPRKRARRDDGSPLEALTRDRRIIEQEMRNHLESLTQLLGETMSYLQEVSDLPEGDPYDDAEYDSDNDSAEDTLADESASTACYSISNGSTDSD